MTEQERAVQVWQVLIAAAHQRQTVTGEALGELVGIHGAELAGPLRRLAGQCAANEWPPLTVLVVDRATGRSGVSIPASLDLDAERERVFRHRWFGMPPLAAEPQAVAAAGPAAAILSTPVETVVKRPCPRCGKPGNPAATLCGYCWTKLEPQAA